MGGIVMIIVSPICAVAGFIFKLYVDKFSKYKTIVKEHTITDIEYKLKEFYFPIYTNLKNETIVNREFVNLKSNLVFEIEKFVLNGHVENQQIIKQHMMKVNPSQPLKELLMQYFDHITVYKLSHEMQKNEDFNIFFITKSLPYPKDLFNKVDSEINRLRLELDTLHNSIV